MLFDLFISFLKIGALSFGGGYAALPLIQNQVVTIHHWLTLTQFTDLISISAMTPGPIAVNSATFVGIKLAGTVGALVATAGSLLPSCFFVAILGFLYSRYKHLQLLQDVLAGLRPAVIAMIASAGVTLTILALKGKDGSSINYWAILIFALSLLFLRWKKTNSILVLLLAGILGGGLYLALGIL
ncbi:chromate transporter [uncultured Sphaerochaeta sp.]|uniref:chromate transporter n=1 Tax=uncultured Sphaerochaeta sp. TaxID=886478 RepID=UPI002A0A7285|nr:chromate transporter [uncultured Sphaerochaeta sp.]